MKRGEAHTPECVTLFAEREASGRPFLRLRTCDDAALKVIHDCPDVAHNTDYVRAVSL